MSRSLLVSHDLTLTGAPRVLVHLACMLRRFGGLPDVAVYGTHLPGAPSLLAELHEAGVPIVELPDVAADPGERQRLLDEYDVIVANTVVPHRWVTALIAEDPDGLGARLAARTIWWIHELHPHYRPDEIFEALKRVRCVVFDSEVGRMSWLEDSGYPELAATEVLHPGVPNDLMEAAQTAIHLARQPSRARQSSRSRVRRELEIDDDAFVVLFLGSVQEQKGIHEVVRAFLALGAPDSGDAETGPAQPAHLVVVGLDEHEDSRRLAQVRDALPSEGQGRVHLVPLDPDVSKWYAAADVFVQNTHPPGEMFGRVTIEAMAHGLPVLASDRGGSVEIVLHGQNGWLHPFNDVFQLTKRLEHLRRSPRLRQRAGRAGRRRVEECFSEGLMFRGWDALIEHVRSSPVLRILGWEPGPPSPFPHMEAQSCWFRGRLLMFGGFRRTWWDLDREATIWDPQRGDWVAGPALPSEEEGDFPLTHAAMASDEDFVYIVSGQPGPRYTSACKAAWALHPPSGRWRRLPDLPVARYNAAGCVVGGELHLFGGNREDRTTHSPEHWIFDLPPMVEDDDEDRRAERRWTALDTGTWRRGRDQPVLGDHCGQCLARSEPGSALYLVGGEHGHAGLAPSEEEEAAEGNYIANPYLMRHDFSADRWCRLSDLPLPVHHIEHQVVALGDRLLVVLGGATHGSRVTERIQVYDRNTDRWCSAEASLPEPLIGAVAWVQGDRIFVNGGQTAISDADRRPGAVRSKTWIGRFELL